MSNALSPTQMTETERISEVADILAAGLLRARFRGMRKSIERQKIGDNSLDNSVELSIYRDTPQRDGGCL